MDIVTAISSISKSLELLNHIKSLDKTYAAAELKLKIAELHEALASAKIALSEAQIQLYEKDRLIEKLNLKNKINFATVQYRGYHFGIDESGKSIGRPFCPVCLTKDDLQIQLIRMNGAFDKCPNCQQNYSGHPYKLPDNFQPS